MRFIDDKISSCHTGRRYEITEVGIMHPEQQKTSVLLAGQVGYITCNMKDPLEGDYPNIMNYDHWHGDQAHLGDTFHRVGERVEALPGFAPTKAMVSTYLMLGKHVI